jgi:hypothetical protein
MTAKEMGVIICVVMAPSLFRPTLSLLAVLRRASRTNRRELRQEPVAP